MNGKKSKKLRKLAKLNTDYTYDQWKVIYMDMKRKGDQQTFHYYVDLETGIAKIASEV